MEKIIKSREILSSIKSELEILQQKIDILSQYNMTNSFIPIDVCAETALALERLSAYEESLFEKLSEFSEAPMIELADAEKVIKNAEQEQARRMLLKKYSGVKTSNPKYEQLLEKLSESAANNDSNSSERIIAEILISDLLNDTKETSKNELVENSEYYKLAFAFNRNELYYQNPDISLDELVFKSDQDFSDNTAIPPDESAADEEPPPMFYSAEYEKNQTIYDIDPTNSDNKNIPDSDLSIDKDSEDTKPDKGALDALTKVQADVQDDSNISIEIRDIVNENRNIFDDNPNDLLLEIEEADKAQLKLNVTDALNMLAPKKGSMRIPDLYYWAILTDLLIHGIKTEDMLCELPKFLSHRISNSTVKNYLGKLYSKGIVMRINFDGCTLYYFTQKGLKINTNDKIDSSFYCFSANKTKPMVSKRDCKIVYPVSKISLCSAVILSRLIKRYPYYTVSCFSDNSVEGLCMNILNKPKDSICILSFVSDNALKLDELLYFITVRSDKLNNLNTLIIGSYTKEQAAVIFRVVKTVLEEKIISSIVIFYSYKEEKYFNPDTLEELPNFGNEENDNYSDISKADEDMSDSDKTSVNSSDTAENEKSIVNDKSSIPENIGSNDVTE